MHRITLIIAHPPFFRYAKSMNKNPDENEDIVPESEVPVTDDSDTLDDSVIAEENSAAAIKKLREKLKKCEADKQEYLTGWQRAKADMVNGRKREEEERKEFTEFANARLIEDLLPVLESFDMAMGNKEAWEKADKNWRIGVEYIYSQLRKALEENGVTEINPMGQPFDQAHHEAISYEPVEDQKMDQKIVAVVQKGYALNGKEIKAPKVKVGEFRP